MRAFRFLATILAFWVAGRALWISGAVDAIEIVAAPDRKPVGNPPVFLAGQVTDSFGEAAGLKPRRGLTAKQRGPVLHPRQDEHVVRITQPQGLQRPAVPPLSIASPGSRPNLDSGSPDATSRAIEEADATLPELATRTQARQPAIAAWMLLRPRNEARSLLSVGELGGSQFGLRAIGPAVVTSGKWTLRPSGRLTSALYSPQQEEGALGIAVRASGTRTSFEASVERRIGLGADGRNAFAAYVAAGGDRSFETAKVDIAVYAQAGMVGLRNRDAFADGSATLHRRILSARHWRAKLGSGIWAGAQPGVARFDIGPSALAEVSIGDIPVRMQLDWRFRAAGSAAPASGPALTIAFTD